MVDLHGNFLADSLYAVFQDNVVFYYHTNYYQSKLKLFNEGVKGIRYDGVITCDYLKINFVQNKRGD